MRHGRRTPPRGATGALLAAIGLGLAGWFGWDWHQLGRWSEDELRASVELNLALDLARDPDAATTVEAQDRLRRQIRLELRDQIEREVGTPRSYTLAGLMMAALGLAQIALGAWVRRPR